MNEPQHWVTVAEAAFRVGRAPRTIYDWITKGHLATRRNSDNTTEVLIKAVIKLEPTMRRGRPAGKPTRRK